MDRTCGNCANGTRYVQCLHDTALYGEDCACNKHVPRSGTLEQRYKQLEQVAKEMLKALEHCEWEPWFEDIPIKFRNRLSELGVNIDD